MLGTLIWSYQIQSAVVAIKTPLIGNDEYCAFVMFGHVFQVFVLHSTLANENVHLKNVELMLSRIYNVYLHV